MTAAAGVQPQWLPREQPVSATAPIVNAFTIDVEDYFQVLAFEPQIRREDWPGYELRVDRNVNVLLDMLAARRVKATFFILGWVAERCPQTVRRIAAEGHEVASHGYFHQQVTLLTPASFREDVLKTRRILEDLGGAEVIGYRAPSYSIGRDNLWALDVLAEAGYRYSSSIYPINHDLYGMPEAPRFQFHTGRRDLVEIPVTTVQMLGRKLPCGGGGYFRLLPYALFRQGLRRVNKHDRRPGVFYVHPWEIDPQQPRIEGARFKSRFRHYLNLNRTARRLERLLADFSWGRMDRVFDFRNA